MYLSFLRLSAAHLRELNSTFYAIKADTVCFYSQSYNIKKQGRESSCTFLIWQMAVFIFMPPHYYVSKVLEGNKSHLKQFQQVRIFNLLMVCFWDENTFLQFPNKKSCLTFCWINMKFTADLPSRLHGFLYYIWKRRAQVGTSQSSLTLTVLLRTTRNTGTLYRYVTDLQPIHTKCSLFIYIKIKGSRNLLSWY